MMTEKLLASTLKDLRKKQNISQATLAEMTKLDRTYVSLIERGQRNPTVKVLIVICKALDTKPSKVLAQIGQ